MTCTCNNAIFGCDWWECKLFEPCQFELLPNVLREDNPKRRYKKKLFRSRNVWKGDGVFLKMIFLEGKGVGNVSAEQELVTETVFDDDWTGLKANVLYSMGKKKRWLLPELLQRNLPTFDDFNLPHTLETVSLDRIRRDRAEIYFPLRSYYDSFRGRDLRKTGGKTKFLKVDRQDGTSTTHEGVYTSINQFLVGEKKSDERRLHFNYSALELETIPGMHNSRTWECSCCHFHRRKNPELEPHKVGVDVGGCSCFEEAFEERLERKYELHYLSEDEEPSDDRPQSTFSLGEFIVKKEKRRVKKRVSQDWVML